MASWPAYAHATTDAATATVLAGPTANADVSPNGRPWQYGSDRTASDGHARSRSYTRRWPSPAKLSATMTPRYSILIGYTQDCSMVLTFSVSPRLDKIKDS